MKKWLSMLLCILLGMAFMPQNMANADAPPLDSITYIILRRSPSFGVVDEMISTSLSMSIDFGTLKYTQERMADEEVIAQNTVYIDPQEALDIAKLAIDSGFFVLEETYDSGVMDGDFTEIVVQIDEYQISVSGLCLDTEGPQAFRTVWQAMLDLYQKAQDVGGTQRPIGGQEKTLFSSQSFLNAVMKDSLLQMPAARYLLPQGWIGRGQVDWLGASLEAPMLVTLTATSPDQAAQAIYQSLTAYCQPVQGIEIYEKGEMSKSLRTMRALMTAEEYAEMLIGVHLPGAEQVELMRMESPPQAVQAEFDAIAETFRQGVLDQLEGQHGKIDVTTAYTCTQGFHTLTLNGKPYLAEWLIPIFIWDTTVINGTKEIQEIIWKVPVVFLYIAEESAYERWHEGYSVFITNITQNKEHTQAIMLAVDEVLREMTVTSDNMLEAIEQVKQRAKQNASASEDYRLANEDSTAHFHEWLNQQNDLTAYDAPDGGIYRVPSAYAFVYADSAGKVIVSSEPLNDASLIPLSQHSFVQATPVK